MQDEQKATDTPHSERGLKAGFDRKSGAATGSGAGAGNPDESVEDYDSDLHGNAPAERDVSSRD